MERVLTVNQAVKTFGPTKAAARLEGSKGFTKDVAKANNIPIFHWVSPRVRAHVCMLAYHLEWHMRQALAPILFDDHDRPAGEALRSSPVAKAKPSPAAKRKANTKRTDDGLPVHSFRTLLADLATLTRNTARWANAPAMALLASPTQIQQRAFDLLGVKPQL